MISRYNNKIHSSEVRFTVKAHASWMSDSENKSKHDNKTQASIKSVPAILRRRASTAGKAALDAAYRCLDQEELRDNINHNIPVIFCSRHGECERSVQLLTDLAQHIPLSPTAFSLSVHNAAAGLFSIARHDYSNNIAIAGGSSTIEHAVIEACGLLADGAKAVLLAAYDSQLPEIFQSFQDCQEEFYAWAWLIQAADNNTDFISLSWSELKNKDFLNNIKQKPAGVEIYNFYINKASSLERISNNYCWQWQWKKHV